jgi:hypothetical protein
MLISPAQPPDYKEELRSLTAAVNRLHKLQFMTGISVVSVLLLIFIVLLLRH